MSNALAGVATLEAELAAARSCSTCGGVPPVSGVPCICNGTNSREAEVDGLRGIAFERGKQIVELEKVAAFATHRPTCCWFSADRHCTCGLNAARKAAGLVVSVP